MSGEYLIGGSSSSSRTGIRKRDKISEVPPPLVGYRFIGVLVLTGGLLLGAGLWRVDAVFQVRDREIETRRLQEIAQKRHDQLITLEARLSDLRRAEVLKSAASNALGMNEPETREIEVLVIPAMTTARWAAAGRRAAYDTHSREVTESKGN